MNSTSSFNTWIIRSKPRSQAKLRLFCFAYAGGSASVFRPWFQAVPAEVEVCAIQLPGREDRLVESAFTRMVPLVDTLAPVLTPYLTMPFAFFGHSLGALVGFELARYLRRGDRNDTTGPLHLFVSGCRAPQLPNPKPPIHTLPEAEFMKELRILNGTPEEVLQHAELMQLLLPTLRADFALTEAYMYTGGEPLACPISAFGGWQDSEVNQEQLLGWRDQTSRSFTLRMFPGDHFFLHSQRVLLLQTISQELTKLVSEIK